MRKLFIIFLLLSPFLLEAQDSISFLKSPQLTGSFKSLGITGGTQLNNGDYVALYNLYFGASSYQGLLIRYDKFGNKINGSEKSTLSLSYFQDLGYGKFAVCSESGQFRYAVYDHNLNLLWQNTTTPSKEIFASLNDSIGFGTYKGVSLNNFRIAKFNLNTGDTIWTKNYKNILGNDSVKRSDYYVNSISSTSQYANVLMASISKDSSIYYQIDLNGKISFKKKFEPGFNLVYSTKRNGKIYSWLIKRDIFIGSPPYLMRIKILENNIEIKEILINDYFKGIKFNFGVAHFQHDKNFYISIYEDGNGNTKNYLGLLKFNVQGNLLFKQRYYVQDEEMIFKSMILTINGSFFFTGESTFLAPENRSFIMKTDSNGFVKNPTLFPLVVDTSWKDTSISLQEINSFQNLFIYPNPTSTTLTISIENNTKTTYTLLDLNGRQILFGEFMSKTQLDVSELKTGMYFLRIQNLENGLVETRKVIVGR